MTHEQIQSEYGVSRVGPWQRDGSTWIKATSTNTIPTSCVHPHCYKWQSKWVWQPVNVTWDAKAMQLKSFELYLTCLQNYEIKNSHDPLWSQTPSICATHLRHVPPFAYDKLLPTMPIIILLNTSCLWECATPSDMPHLLPSGLNYVEASTHLFMSQCAIWSTCCLCLSLDFIYLLFYCFLGGLGTHVSCSVYP